MTLKLDAAFSACCLLLLSSIVGCQSPITQAEQNSRKAAMERATKGKALFEEKCRVVAGEKIYRTVDDVDGISLLKVRPPRGDRELADRLWSGAAFARESPADEYIKTFLGYEHSSSAIGRPVTRQYRGYIGTDYQPDNPSNLPGYRFVEVVGEDGQRYRYTLIKKTRPTSKTGWVDTILEKTPVSSAAPRYGVTFEDHVVPEERALGVASSTVKVLDLRSQEILGELTRYAWSPGAPSPDNPTPWLTAYRCPDHAVGTNAATRKFVDQVLIPSKGN